MAAKKKAAPAPAAQAKPTTGMKITPHAPPPKASVPVSGAITVHKLEQVADAIEGMIPNVLKLEDAATRIVIKDEDTFNKGSGFVGFCKRELDQLDALYKAVHGPVWDYSKLIQATFRPVRERLEKIRDQATAAMTAFYRAEEARKAAEAKALREAQEAEANRIALEHAAAGRQDVANAVLEAALNAPPPVAAVTLGRTVNAAGGSTAARKMWKGAIPTTLEDRNAALQAIIDGKLPGIVIEWKQSELNTVARQVQAVGVFHGIKVTHEADLSYRGG